jgi:hypothetical protein
MKLQDKSMTVLKNIQKKNKIIVFFILNHIGTEARQHTFLYMKLKTSTNSFEERGKFFEVSDSFAYWFSLQQRERALNIMSNMNTVLWTHTYHTTTA